MGKYWEVTGKTRKQIAELIGKRKPAMDALRAFAKRHGGSIATAESGMRISAAVAFDEPPDAKLWKEHKQSPGCFLPRLTSKEGKAIAKELDELCEAMPSAEDVGRVIKMDIFGSDEDGRFVWRTPGFLMNGKRVYLSTHDGYQPPKELEAEIKRVSDLEYEKAAG